MVEWWGRLPYPLALARMEAALAARIEGSRPDSLFLVEHEPVYTVGRSRGALAHVHDPGEIPVVPVSRGGDVTFHGPGQLTAYPVVALPEGRQDLHAWLRGLEDFLIDLLGTWGVAAGRDPRNTGVWVGGRKVAAIGVACRRWVCWHGFALNVDVDLGYFDRIDPCGMSPELVTRLADHAPVDLQAARQAVERRFPPWWEGWSTGPP